jgi:hypothetical protein
MALNGNINPIHPLNLFVKQTWDNQVLAFDDRNESHVIRKDMDFILDFLRRRAEGSLLISGRRGVGKTNLIFSAIYTAKSELRSSNITMIPVIVNATDFKYDEDQTPQDEDPIESTEPKFKRNILKNIIRKLYLETKKIPAKEDEKVTQNSSTTSVVGKKDEGLASSLGISSLYDRSQANKFERTSTSDQIENEKLTEERKSSVNINLSKEFFIIILSAISGLITQFTEALSSLKSIILPITLLIPAIVIGVEYTRSKTQLKEQSEELKNSSFYKYDYDVPTLEFELQTALERLKALKYRIVFVIDELDKLIPKQVITVLTSLKTLINHGSSIFIFITDDDFFRKLELMSADRSEFYTLFPQKIFLQRPDFAEVRQFLTNIIDPSLEQNAMYDLFELNNAETYSFTNFKPLPSDADLFKDTKNLSIKKQKDSITIEYVDPNTWSISAIKRPSISLRPSDNEKILNIATSDRKNIKYEFLVIKKNGTPCVYLKSTNYEYFQYYACFKAKTDFFDLNNLIRGNIEPDKKGALKILFEFDKKKITLANLQRCIEAIYQRKKIANPSEWYSNDMVLKKLYDLVIGLLNDDARYLVIDDPFKLFFLDDDEVIEQSRIQEDFSDSEVSALKDLINYFIRLKVLIPTSVNNKYEISPNLQYVDPTIKTLVDEEMKFVQNYNKIKNLVTYYEHLHREYFR